MYSRSKSALVSKRHGVSVRDGERVDGGGRGGGRVSESGQKVIGHGIQRKGGRWW